MASKCFVAQSISLKQASFSWQCRVNTQLATPTVHPFLLAQADTMSRNQPELLQQPSMLQIPRKCKKVLCYSLISARMMQTSRMMSDSNTMCEVLHSSRCASQVRMDPSVLPAPPRMLCMT